MSFAEISTTQDENVIDQQQCKLNSRAAKERAKKKKPEQNPQIVMELFECVYVLGNALFWRTSFCLFYFDVRAYEQLQIQFEAHLSGKLTKTTLSQSRK